MDEIMQCIQLLGLPTTVIAVIAACWLALQIVGEVVELFGKTAPEFIKIRKYFSRKKAEKKQAEDERQTTLSTLQKVQALLHDVNQHYNIDNISQRDQWIDWVNTKSKVYDNVISDLAKKLDDTNQKLDANNEITLSLLIDNKRNAIIDFESKVVDDNYPVTKEQFNRIFKIHDEYEAIIKKHNMTNGEVDIAYLIIKESYAKHMRDHSFLEEIRGYGNHTI